MTTFTTMVILCDQVNKVDKTWFQKPECVPSENLIKVAKIQQCLALNAS